MSAKRLPLLRLPLLALCKIMKDFDIEDVLYLSLFSKRARLITKMCWKQEVPLSICVMPLAEHVEICAYLEDDEEIFNFNIREGIRFPNRENQKITIGDVVVNSVRMMLMDKIHYETFWPNKFLGIMNTISHLTELFGCKVNNLTFSSEQEPNEIKQVIDWVMSRQESIVGSTAFRLTDETLAHLLNKCKITGNLIMYGQPSRAFRHTWNLDMDYFCTENSLFLTYKDIMKMNCKYINIKESELTSRCVNKFLKNWLNGGNPRLSSMLIIMNSVDQQRIFKGIETVEQPETLRRYISCQGNKRIRMRGGYDIKRSDGTIGTAFFNRFVGIEFAVNARNSYY